MREVEFRPSPPSRLANMQLANADMMTPSAAIRRRTTLIWAEHCTECAMPACYSTCSLYSPRPDLKCRRLSNGVQGIAERPDWFRVQFRQWGKLEATGCAALVSVAAAQNRAKLAKIAQGALNQPWLSYDFARRAGGRLNGLLRPTAPDRAPDGFLAKVYNSGDQAVSLVLTFKQAQGQYFFQENLPLPPGLSEHFIPRDKFKSVVDVDQAMIIQLEPAEPTDSEFTFSFLDFVLLAEPYGLSGRKSSPLSQNNSTNTSDARPAVKCVLWDLDNTLWSGTLVEDGIEGVRLNPIALHAILELDKRGILNSVVSKNSPEDAEKALKHFGIFEYFVHPHISWRPKSEAPSSIAKLLNINVDTFLFVDDQSFERVEVGEFFPNIEVFDAAIIHDLLNHPRLKGENSSEARRRRIMYQEDERRTVAMQAEAMQEGSSSTIVEFLRNCSISLIIEELNSDNIARAFDLAERTNQLNYAGYRLGRDAVEALVANPMMKGLVLSAADRFSDYGIVGFAVLDQSDWTVTNFFMSCRVQRKKVDHAFFEWASKLAKSSGAENLRIVYRGSARNAPSKEVLSEDMGLACEVAGDTTLFLTPRDRAIELSDIVAIVDHTKPPQS